MNINKQFRALLKSEDLQNFTVIAELLSIPGKQLTKGEISRWVNDRHSLDAHKLLAFRGIFDKLRQKPH